MRTMMKKATLAVALGASAIVASAPADAQYRRYDRYRGNRGGDAVIAGIAGLAIGAALTANRNDRRYDYDRGYYAQRGYYPNDGYYARNYYNQYDGYDRCYTRKVYDPYIGRRVRVRYCN